MAAGPCGRADGGNIAGPVGNGRGAAMAPDRQAHRIGPWSGWPLPARGDRLAAVVGMLEQVRLQSFEVVA